MPVLSAIDLGHAYGAADLFHDLSLAVEARDRIGLVGPNGVGKTTLLLALAGLLEPGGGRVEYTAGLTLGYLRQEAVLTFAGRENTVYQEMLTAFADLRRREAELAAMEAALSADYSEELLAEYGALQESFEVAVVALPGRLTGRGTARAEHVRVEPRRVGAPALRRPLPTLYRLRDHRRPPSSRTARRRVGRSTRSTAGPPRRRR